MEWRLLVDWRPLNLFTVLSNLVKPCVLSTDRVSVDKIRRNVGLADIRADDADGVLVSSIGGSSCVQSSLGLVDLTLSVVVLIVKSLRLVVHDWNPFSDGEPTHFVLDPHLILQVFLLAPHHFLVLFHLLLFDLLLKGSLHCQLLLLSFLLQQRLLISAEQNVALPLQLKVDSVIQHSASGLDVWEVLLGDSGVKHLLHFGLVVALDHVKCLVVV